MQRKLPHVGIKGCLLIAGAVLLGWGLIILFGWFILRGIHSAMVLIED